MYFWCAIPIITGGTKQAECSMSSSVNVFHQTNVNGVFLFSAFLNINKFFSKIYGPYEQSHMQTEQSDLLSQFMHKL